MVECHYCRNPVKSHWNFCRKCGARLFHKEEAEELVVKDEVIEVAKEDSSSPTGMIYEPLEVEEVVVDEEEEKKELTDEELVERIADVIVKREDFNTLLKKKADLDDEINKMLDRVKNKLIPRNEALPKIKELKVEVDAVTAREADFENFSAILPIEEIIEDRTNERKKLKKLSGLKGDKAVSRATFDEMETKYKKNIENLTIKLNVELAKMRKTFDALERKMKSLQRDLEVLYVNSQTGEISEKAYEKHKQEKSVEIEKMKKVSKTVADILAEAR
ncbi:MAG: zinc ribbon domain-containing protein [Candidatus Heimdallarchaeota archaeon]|nr:zinc ribbon domain-containing protein [Candidatus Heimdallarchaeota archaeon]MCK4769107.1 zinc ribbon domain-containing protein [Candidatus Heimdallarchaeota archaeon]